MEPNHQGLHCQSLILGTSILGSEHGLPHRHLARTPGRPADQYGARSTLSLFATVLRVRSAQFLHGEQIGVEY